MILQYDDRDFLKHQLEFIYSEKELTILVGGAGSGKSYSVVALALYNLINKVDTKSGKSFGIVVYPKLQLAESIFKQKFLMLLHQLGIKYTKPSPNYIKTIYGDIVIVSATDPESIVGYDATWAIWDEADNGKYNKLKLVYDNVTQRLRGGGKVGPLYLVGTPEGFKLLYELAEKDFEKYKHSKDKDDMLTYKGLLANRNIIRARTYDNKHISPRFIQRLKEQYEPSKFNAYVNGLFVNLNQGRAYKVFDRALHCTKKYVSKQRDILVGIDFNIDHFSIVFAEQLQNGCVIVFDEVRRAQFTTKDAVNLIQQRYPNKRIILFPDMTGRHGSTSATSATTTDLQILSTGKTKLGSFVLTDYRSNPLQKDRMNVVNVAFNNNKILIDERCDILIKDLEQVALDPKTGGIDKSTEGSGMNHMSDAFGYIVYRMLPIDYTSTGGMRVG